MRKLYCVPLGHSPRSLFYEKLQSVGYDKGVLVLPSRILMQQAQREANIRTIDIDFLATTILNDNGYLALRQINRRSQELIIKNLVKYLAKRDKLEYFGALAEKPGFIKALTSLVGQLSRSGASEQEIMRVLRDLERDGNLGQKDWEISQLYGLYRNYLKTNDWFDLEGKYRLAIKVLQEKNVKLRWQEVCISDFFTFDPLQIEFIKALGKRTDVSVGLMYEGAEEKKEIFQAVEKTYSDLISDAEFERVNLPEKKTPENVRVCQFPDRHLEMEWVLTEVKRLLVNGEEAKNILVTFRKFDDYSGLRKLADTYGIPVSIPQSSSLNLQPLSELALLLLEAKPDTRKGAEAYFKILGSALGKVLFKIDGELANAWREEKYFTTRSQVQLKCKEAFIDEAGVLAIIDNSIEKLQTTSTVAEYSAVLQEFLESLNLERELGALHKNGSLEFLGVKACLNSKQLILKCLQSLTEDYANCGAGDEKLSLQEFSLALREAMQDYQVTLVEGRNDGVLITEVINAQGLAHKYVFLMGLREGEFPTGSNENWIYNDKERTELQSQGIDMPTTAIAYQEDAYFFESTLAQAGKSLVFTYHVDDKAGASAYVGEALKKFGVEEEKIIEKQPASMGESFAPGIKELGFIWIGLNLPRPVLGAVFIDRSRNHFANLNGVLEKQDLRDDVASFVGNVFSPSSLEIYAQCPFEFLGERVWKQSLFNEKEEQATPLEVGNIFHECLAKFLGKHLQEKLPKYAFDQLWEELKQDFQDVASDFIAKGAVIENELWLADQNRYLITLRKWLSNEYELQKQWDFVPYAVEWDFGSKNGKPLRMKLADGKSFSIVGRIDRVDKNGDKLFVTDYKLSSTPSVQDFKNGLDLQLPIYLLAASREKGKEVIGGGYFSLKDTKRGPNVTLDDSQTIPFTTKYADVFADEADKWQAFKQMSEKNLQDYVDGIYKGNFKVQPKKNNCNYCALKGICRLNVIKQGGEGDE